MMNRRTVSTVIALALIGAMLTVIICLVVCIKTPVQSDIGATGMTLTLENETGTTAYFSGEPVNAWISLRDSLLFDDIAWHLGSGKFLYPAAVQGKKIKDIKVKLFWDIMPLRKDSASGMYYDSIYISKGGELYRSNGAKVFVTNLAPVIDSIKISARAYDARDTLRDTVKAYDSLASLIIRVFAHDRNQNTLKCSWVDPAGRITPISGSLNASYLIARSNYTDTIRLSVYDGLGGSCNKSIFITTDKFRNRPPLIDSIRIKDSVYSGASPVFYAAVAVADSLSFRVFAHDSDVTDNISVQWTDKNVKQVLLKPKAGEMTMVWACTSSTCKDTTKKAALSVLDTVTVTVRDNDSAFAVKTIIVVKGYLGPNKPPVFDSLRVNDTVAKGAWTLLRYQATCRDTIRFRMYGHDPDSADTAHWIVRCPDSTRLTTASDTGTLYVCKDTLYKDTVTFLLSDKHLGSTLRQIIVDVNNRYPLFDSVRCADTVFKTIDSVYKKNVSVGDSVVVKIFGHDPDAGDSVTIRWSPLGSINDTARFKAITGNQAVYVCKDSIFMDTCGLRVIDKRKAAARKRLCMNICNHAPFIDSITCADTVFKAASAVYGKACKGNDSVAVTLFARDTDVADTLKDTLFAAGKIAPLRLAAMQYRYVCKDSTYIDTLTAIVKDPLLKKAMKKIRISITKK